MIFLILIILAVAALLILAFRFLINRFTALQSIYLKIHRMLFFNSFLRSIQKGYLNFAIATFISIRAVQDDIAQQIISVAIGFVLLSIPIATTYFFHNYFPRLNNEDFQLRFGSLYLNLNTYDPLAMRHTILYFLRRLFYASLIVFLAESPTLQNMAFLLSSVGLIGFQLIYLPMEDWLSQALEIYNEVTIALTASLVTAFTADSFTPETNEARMNFGWIIVALTCANIVVNWVAMGITVGVQIYTMIKNMIAKRKAQITAQKQSSEDKYALKDDEVPNIEKKDQKQEELEQQNDDMKSLTMLQKTSALSNDLVQVMNKLERQIDPPSKQGVGKDEERIIQQQNQLLKEAHETLVDMQQVQKQLKLLKKAQHDRQITLQDKDVFEEEQKLPDNDIWGNNRVLH